MRRKHQYVVVRLTTEEAAVMRAAGRRLDISLPSAIHALTVAYLEDSANNQGKLKAWLDMVARHREFTG